MTSSNSLIHKYEMPINTPIKAKTLAELINMTSVAVGANFGASITSTTINILDDIVARSVNMEISTELDDGHLVCTAQLIPRDVLHPMHFVMNDFIEAYWRNVLDLHYANINDYLYLRSILQ